MLKKDNKKPLLSDALAGDDNKGLESAKADQHTDRITRFGTLKHRAKKQEQYLWSLFTPGKNTQESNLATKHAQKLKGCANFLLFKNFYTIEQVKLAKLQSCGQHLLCPFCASIRASRSVQKYTEKINHVLYENRKLKPILITFTVKNGSDLAERSEHLIKSFRKLLGRRRDYLKKGWGFNEFCKIQGAMYSYENTYNEKTKEWHPHIHMFALIDNWIDQEALSETWHEVTGDSFIVDVRRVKKDKEYGYSKAAAEVCKYALKFGDLSVENTWQAFKVLKGKRLTGSFGLLWGVNVPDQMTDDMPTDDLPYLEMLYKFVYGKKSYYDLATTRLVEPRDRSNEEAKGDDNERGRAYRVVHKDDTIALSVPTCGRHAKYVRKKQHWQISPYIRVRVKKRIKRWDGYLCVLRI